MATKSSRHFPGTASTTSGRMKRTLVEYSGSEEETAPGNEQPKQKKRKLPPLSPSLTVPAPIDNPAQHQGRVRTVPHVEGQYATHIYVPLVLYPRDALYKLVEEVLTLAKAHVPSLLTIGRQEHDKAMQWELHISLSRPLFLRAHQREEFKRTIKQVASSVAPFDASFTTISALTNDERTRTFLALDVGAGHKEFRRCLDILGPALRSLRQKEFYIDPKFHSSIAWALLEKPPSPPNLTSFAMAVELDEIASSERDALEEEQHAPEIETQLSDNFQRIPHFPHALVPTLNEACAAKISQARTGGFVVDRIAAKIGKDVFTWPLTGMK